MVSLGDVGNAISGALSDLGSRPTNVKENVELLVNGKRFAGWKTVSIKRSIKAIAGAFELGVTDKWAQEQTSWLIKDGDECKLMVGSEVLITGYVDTVEPSYDASQRSIQIAGRDKAGDLVDCSAVHSPGAWQGITLGRLATILAKPFGVEVTDTFKSTQQLSVNLNQSETVFHVLEEKARKLGVLLMNDGKGNIVISRAGTARAGTDLVEGVNILAARGAYSMKERYSEYKVIGQSAAYADGEADPLMNFQAKGTAKDAGVKRYRPLLINAESNSLPNFCKTRAQWEATVRAARAFRLPAVRVAGWRRANGKLWALNELANVKSPFLGVDQEFLISSISFDRGDGGTTTTLELERPDAYNPEPLIKDDEGFGALYREASR